MTDAIPNPWRPTVDLAMSPSPLAVRVYDGNRLYQRQVDFDGELQALSDDTIRLITRRHKWDSTGMRSVGRRTWIYRGRDEVFSWLADQTGYDNLGQAIALGEIELLRAPRSAVAATAPRRGRMTIDLNGRRWHLLTENRETVRMIPVHRELPLVNPYHGPASALKASHATRHQTAEYWAIVELWAMHLCQPPDPSWIFGSRWQRFRGTGSFAED